MRAPANSVAIEAGAGCVVCGATGGVPEALFRFILALPILVVRYIMGLLLEVGAFAAWFVIVITGKMPRGLFDVLVLANSYTARSDAYLLLLTETYPPFQDEQTCAAGTPYPPQEPPIT
ncbi:MAG TPA: DUF4389 domain-containing protein [Solirubrobacteraceae bacterium]|nr:DUF4389 domain-containing protein [Solirubrobacteraceae bacterium]